MFHLTSHPEHIIRHYPFIKSTPNETEWKIKNTYRSLRVSHFKRYFNSVKSQKDSEYLTIFNGKPLPGFPANKNTTCQLNNVASVLEAASRFPPGNYYWIFAFVYGRCVGFQSAFFTPTTKHIMYNKNVYRVYNLHANIWFIDFAHSREFQHNFQRKQWLDYCYIDKRSN